MQIRFLHSPQKSDHVALEMERSLSENNAGTAVIAENAESGRYANRASHGRSDT
jgi:hypothetical protein